MRGGATRSRGGGAAGGTPPPLHRRRRRTGGPSDAGVNAASPPPSPGAPSPDDAAFVELAVQLHHDFAGAVVVHDLELADVAWDGREGRGAPGRATRNGGPGVSKSQDARLGDAKRGLQVRRSPGSPSQTPGKGGGTWSLRPRGLPLPLFSPLPLFKSGPGVSKSDSKRCPGDLGLGRGGTQHVSMICQPALMCTWRKAA